MNPPPTLTLSGSCSIAECLSYTLDLSYSGGWNTSISQWEVDWGDSTATAGYTSTPGSSLPHNYLGGAGVYTITAWLVDNGVYISGNSIMVTVRNALPVLTISSSSSSVEIGQSVGISGTYYHDGPGDLNCRIDWGDGAIDTSTFGLESPLGPAQGSLSDTHTYSTYGLHPVTVDLSDINGGHDIETAQITVPYPPLSLQNVAMGQSLNEGDTFTLAGDAVNLEGVAFTLSVNWGDGTEQNYPYSSGLTSFSEPHPYRNRSSNTAQDSDLYTIGLTMTTSDGRVATRHRIRRRHELDAPTRRNRLRRFGPPRHDRRAVLRQLQRGRYGCERK